ncbi:hypothetical protein [Prauserella cavernicola]|uniref:Uncharacterized protein n=1 Tax=Prauserella cavernicola TaxID=2800127 RepID=A0A934QWM6_9PSEU|nr:hypothetical protein [Prauserella cavernicola]MBK1787745.1 hypothetical protein [Prauserella cavernicola]
MTMPGAGIPDQAPIRVIDGPKDLATLRRRVRAMLTDTPEAQVIDALLVSNELATIAWLQAGQPFMVRLISPDGHTLRTEVETASFPTTDLGRAGELLDKVARAWGIERRECVTLWADVTVVQGAHPREAAPPRPRAAAPPSPS